MRPTGELFLAENHAFQYALTRPNLETRQPEPAAGLVDLRCWLSLTDGGAPIDGALDVEAFEADELPGTYFGSIPQAAVEEHVTGLHTVYRIFGKEGEALVSTRLRVRAIRPVTPVACSS